MKREQCFEKQCMFEWFNGVPRVNVVVCFVRGNTCSLTKLVGHHKLSVVQRSESVGRQVSIIM